MKNEDKPKQRILILSVDRDNDIGVKTGLETPLIGEESVLNAAVQLLINDPEEADGNTLFATINLFRNYKRKADEDLEVAAIAGSQEGGIEADKKMVKELELVLKQFPADSIILVTDGYADEEIIPIINSRIPILSIKHVVVKHSRSVEETYAVLGRYLRMLWNENPYRIYFLAIPGIIVAIFGLSILLDLTHIAISLSFIIAGLAMIVKGLGVDEYIYNLSKAPFSEYIRLASYVISIISLFSGIYLSYLSIADLEAFKYILANPSSILTYGVPVITTFLPNFLLTIIVTTFIYVFGMSLYSIATGKYYRIIRYLLVLESTLIIFIAGNEATKVLLNPEYGLTNLIIYISIGLMILSITIIGIYILARRRRHEIEAETI